MSISCAISSPSAITHRKGKDFWVYMIRGRGAASGIAYIGATSSHPLKRYAQHLTEKAKEERRKVRHLVKRDLLFRQPHKLVILARYDTAAQAAQGERDADLIYRRFLTLVSVESYAGSFYGRGGGPKWTSDVMTDQELITEATKVGAFGRGDLGKKSAAIYNALLRRGLLDVVFPPPTSDRNTSTFQTMLDSHGIHMSSWHMSLVYGFTIGRARALTRRHVGAFLESCADDVVHLEYRAKGVARGTSVVCRRGAEDAARDALKAAVSEVRFVGDEVSTGGAARSRRASNSAHLEFFSNTVGLVFTSGWHLFAAYPGRWASANAAREWAKANAATRPEGWMTAEVKAEGKRFQDVHYDPCRLQDLEAVKAEIEAILGVRCEVRSPPIADAA